MCPALLCPQPRLGTELYTRGELHQQPPHYLASVICVHTFTHLPPRRTHSELTYEGVEGNACPPKHPSLGHFVGEQCDVFAEHRDVDVF
jgi:hypothetical protein